MVVGLILKGAGKDKNRKRQLGSAIVKASGIIEDCDWVQWLGDICNLVLTADDCFPLALPRTGFGADTFCELTEFARANMKGDERTILEAVIARAGACLLGPVW